MSSPVALTGTHDTSPVALTGTHDTSPVALTGVVDVWTGEILDPALNFSKALNSQYLGAI